MENSNESKKTEQNKTNGMQICTGKCIEFQFNLHLEVQKSNAPIC